MHRALKQAFEALEQQRIQTMEYVRHLSDEELNRTPAVGKWSVAQILSHIISAERLSGLYIRKKLQGASETADSGLWEEVKFFVLTISQRLPGLKFKAPRNVVERTQLYHDLPTIHLEWSSVREDLRSVLEKIPEEYTRRKIFRHAR